MDPYDLHQPNYEDPNAPGKGCFTAILIGLAIWILPILLYRYATP